jgi:hypothetical protein
MQSQQNCKNREDRMGDTAKRLTALPKKMPRDPMPFSAHIGATTEGFEARGDADEKA